MAKRKVKHSKKHTMAKRRSTGTKKHHRRRKRSHGLFSAGAGGLMKNPIIGAIGGVLAGKFVEKMLDKIPAMSNPMLKGLAIAGVGFMVGKKVGNPGLQYSMLGVGASIALKGKFGLSDNAPYDFVNPNVLSDPDDFSDQFTLSAGNPYALSDAMELSDDEFSASPYENVLIPDFHESED